MKRTLAATLVALAAIVGGTPGFAQDDATAGVRDIINTQLPPETRELADELVQITGTARLFDSLLPNIADEAKNRFIKGNPQMQLGIISVVDKVAVEMVSRRPELDRYLARVWASGFTNDQMSELIEFYKTDTGQKLAQTQGQLLAVQTAAADDWAQSVAEELDQRVREELRAAMESEQRALQGDIAGPAAQEAPQQ